LLTSCGGLAEKRHAAKAIGTSIEICQRAQKSHEKNTPAEYQNGTAKTAGHERGESGTGRRAGKRASRAAAREAIAATAVREERITTGQSSQPGRRFASRLRLLFGIGSFVCLYRYELQTSDSEESGKAQPPLPANWMPMETGLTMKIADFLSGEDGC
jgi:hypothetical protein